MKGDRGLLIWLGKQRLGQKDSHELTTQSTIEVKVVRYGSDQSPKTWSD